MDGQSWWGVEGIIYTGVRHSWHVDIRLSGSKLLCSGLGNRQKVVIDPLRP
jgi:hypothetical protein